MTIKMSREISSKNLKLGAGAILKALNSLRKRLFDTLFSQNQSHQLLKSQNSKFATIDIPTK
jgi:hypothetical protein